MDEPIKPAVYFKAVIVLLALYGVFALFQTARSWLNEREYSIDFAQGRFVASLDEKNPELIKYWQTFLTDIGSNGIEVVRAVLREKSYPKEYFAYLKDVAHHRYDDEWRTYLVDQKRLEEAIDFAKASNMRDMDAFLQSISVDQDSKRIACRAKTEEYFYAYAHNIVSRYVQRPTSLKLGPLDDRKTEVKIDRTDPCSFYAHGYYDVGVDAGAPMRFRFSFVGKADPQTDLATHKNIKITGWAHYPK